MKILSIIFLFTISCSLYSQQYWLSVNSPTGYTLRKSHFVDTTYGWATGDSGTIVHTSNSGLNWVLQNSGITDFGVDDIFFINRNTGWALANDFFYEGTVILRTSNGGINWTSFRYPDTTLVFNIVYFLDSLTGFLSGYSGVIYKTTNSGVNWFNCNIDTAYCPPLYLFPKNKFYFINSQTGFACGGQVDIQGMVWKTSDSGLNWKTYCVSSEPLYDIKAISESKIVSTGGDFEYGLSSVVSTNGGNDWIYEFINILGKGQALAYRTPEEVWVPLSYSQTFAVNTDSGNIGTNWREIATPGNLEINSTVFMTPTFGWSFGSLGSIFKYNTAVIGINNSIETIPDAFYLHQNFPNPFNPETSIGYTLNRGGIIKAEIFNVLGEAVAEFLNIYQPSGYHVINWNAIDMPSGIYFCKVTSSGRSKSIKILLIK